MGFGSVYQVGSGAPARQQITLEDWGQPTAVEGSRVERSQVGGEQNTGEGGGPANYHIHWVLETDGVYRPGRHNLARCLGQQSQGSGGGPMELLGRNALFGFSDERMQEAGLVGQGLGAGDPESAEHHESGHGLGPGLVPIGQDRSAPVAGLVVGGREPLDRLPLELGDQCSL